MVVVLKKKGAKTGTKSTDVHHDLLARLQSTCQTPSQAALQNVKRCVTRDKQDRRGRDNIGYLLNLGRAVNFGRARLVLCCTRVMINILEARGRGFFRRERPPQHAPEYPLLHVVLEHGHALRR